MLTYDDWYHVEMNCYSAVNLSHLLADLEFYCLYIVFVQCMYITCAELQLRDSSVWCVCVCYSCTWETEFL